MDLAIATRPVHPDDEPRFYRMWPRLSPETVYRRFHAPLHGLPRDAVPARYRFASRNLRALFARLNSTGNVRSAFPVRLTSLAGEVSRDMRWGTMDFFDVRVPAESASVRVRFAPGSTDRGFATAAAAQYAVFRLPE